MFGINPLTSSVISFSLSINISAVYFSPQGGRDNYWAEEPYSNSFNFTQISVLHT